MMKPRKRKPINCVHYTAGVCDWKFAPKFYRCDGKLIDTCEHYEERTPHCSQCVFYDILPEQTMYCYHLKRTITKRKKPCAEYKE